MDTLVRPAGRARRHMGGIAVAHIHTGDVHCVMPPSPELEEKIIAAKAMVAAGMDLSEVRGGRG